MYYRVKLGNDAVSLDGTVLYADLSGSTKLVDTKKPTFAAEIYKTYLACAAKVIKSEGGVITAYDGDRVMAVFINKDNKNTSAVRAAFKINGVVRNIITPGLKSEYPQTDYVLKHVIGIDASKLLASRIGVRNDNDLVWVGRAANYAAKLSNLSDEVAIRITHSVYDQMLESVKIGGVNKENMWEERIWTGMNNMRIYRTIEWTKPHLSKFLHDLANTTGALRIHVIAHSMGNRALVKILDSGVSGGQSLYNQVVLTAPDIDAGEFLQLASRIRSAAERITLYASSNDNAMSLSKKMHTYPRAGESGDDIVVVTGMDTVDASSVDTSLTGHSYYAEKRTVLSDLFYLLKDGAPPSERHGLDRKSCPKGEYWAFRP